ncbi:MAG: cohesin domain-containing protein [Desulfobacterales bacterium]|nr:cohesin domain-containing protein [Desulfobacterales bacterium]
MKKIVLICMISITLSLASSVQAVTSLSFLPQASSVASGDTMAVDIIISGLESQDLSAYDFNVSFDNTILAFQEYSLGSGLGAPGDSLDLSLGDLGLSTNLAEVSLLWDFSSQEDAFTLATLTFTALLPGETNLSFSIDDWQGFTDGDDNWLTIDEFNTAEITVSSVPIPSSLSILGFGLFSLIICAKRKRRVSL